MVLQQAEDVLRELYGSWSSGHTNFVFKLHYLVSFHLITIFLLATSVQLFESNYVNCVGTKGEVEEHIDKFAYYFSTFSRVENEDGTTENKMVRHNYYFWVPVLFVYHLCVFRWTYHVWQGCGGKLLRKLDEDKNKTKLFVRYIGKRIKFKLNDTWLFQLMFLEFQNILVCIHQWITTNYVLNGMFYRLGLESFENLKKIFPYQTKFSFTTYGPSGSIQIKDYMCILGLNALYKYIFSFYWWWLVILTILTVGNFVYRVALIMLRPRIWFWEKNMVTWLLTDKKWFLTLRYSDWVFMKYLHEAVSLRKYRRVLRYLADPKIERQPGEEPSSSESSDESGNEEDKKQHEDHEEQRDRYRDLLETIIRPVPMLTDADSNEADGLRFRSRGHLSDPTATDSSRITALVRMPRSSSHYNENAEASPQEENVAEQRTENTTVLFTSRPVENGTNSDSDMPEGDPLLNNVRDSENGSSKSGESEGVRLDLGRESVKYKFHKKN